MNQIKNILEIESNPKILSYKNSKNDPIWMYMRQFVLYNFVSEKILNSPTIYSPRRMNFKSIMYMIKATFHNAFYRKKRVDYAFYSSADYFEKDNYVYNRFSDLLSISSGNDNITFENAPINWKWEKKRVNNNIVYVGPNLAYNSFFTKTNKYDYQKCIELLNYVSNVIFELFNVKMTDDDKTNISNLTCKLMYKIDKHSDWLVKQAKKYSIKMIIMVGGSYSHYYSINKKMKASGILISDLQHGFITEKNTFYNYNLNLINTDEVKIATPNFYLVYGSWWSSQTNLPYENIYSIGNPFRDYQLKNIKKMSGKRIMVIGCAQDTLKYIELSNKLGNYFGKNNVVFRPHPLERNYVTENIDFDFCFELDLNRNIYSALEDSCLIISEVSTVLFEAIGIVENIFVLNTDFSRSILPNHPFTNVNDFDDIIIKVKNKSVLSVDENIFWDTNWAAKFQSFVNDEIKKED